MPMMGLMILTEEEKTTSPSFQTGVTYMVKSTYNPGMT